ncbi:MAG: hypothetical protein HY751_12985 [Nitrospinae bacterium]|nr:hypothetical protein [Nitrospinota bacterium]
MGAKPAGKVPAGPKPLVADRVDLLGEKKPSGLAVNSPVGTVYDYDVSDYHQLVVKVVNAQNRAEVVRQYPSEESLSLKDAYRRFLKLIGM